MAGIKEYRFLIGIDPGVSTGFALWNSEEKKFISLDTLKIHEAMDTVKVLYQKSIDMFVRVEDARKKKWFGNTGRERLKGLAVCVGIQVYGRIFSKIYE